MIVYKHIVLLCGDFDTTPILFNSLQQHAQKVTAIEEKPISKKEFLKKRIKKLGFITVVGQVLFQLLTAKWQRKFSQKRIVTILNENGFSFSTIPSSKLVKTESVNNDECLQQINRLQPDLIILHGTRIVSRRILQQLKVPVINIHAGITPAYRGVHGGYWALVENDKNHCGVTVHYVNAGIDTGEIIYQALIAPTAKDNFSTYPYLQLIKGLEGLGNFLQNNKIISTHPATHSKLWYHPTLWSYWYNRIFNGVK